MFIDEMLYLMLHFHTTKMSFGLSLLKQNDSRKPSHFVTPRKLHIFTFIDLQLCQQHIALIRGNHTAQDRCDHQTGGTPLGPEIHQDRPLPGGKQYILVEIFQAFF